MKHGTSASWHCRCTSCRRRTPRHAEIARGRSGTRPVRAAERSSGASDHCTHQALAPRVSLFARESAACSNQIWSLIRANTAKLIAAKWIRRSRWKPPPGPEQGQLDYWVKERLEWRGRVRGGRQRWIKAIDLRSASGSQPWLVLTTGAGLQRRQDDQVDEGVDKQTVHWTSLGVGRAWERANRAGGGLTCVHGVAARGRDAADPERRRGDDLQQDVEV